MSTDPGSSVAPMVVCSRGQPCSMLLRSTAPLHFLGLAVFKARGFCVTHFALDELEALLVRC